MRTPSAIVTMTRTTSATTKTLKPSVTDMEGPLRRSSRRRWTSYSRGDPADERAAPRRPLPSRVRGVPRARGAAGGLIPPVVAAFDRHQRRGEERHEPALAPRLGENLALRD